MVSYALERMRKDITMGKIKYSEEMKLQTVKYVLEVENPRQRFLRNWGLMRIQYVVG